jgi:glutamate synthase domain-containing protein 1
VNLPKHICLSIRHNPHLSNYETIERWLEQNEYREEADISPEDGAAILASGEVWVISWCPETPVGSRSVASATLERALELANS